MFIILQNIDFFQDLDILDNKLIEEKLEEFENYEKNINFGVEKRKKIIEMIKQIYNDFSPTIYDFY